MPGRAALVTGRLCCENDAVLYWRFILSLCRRGRRLLSSSGATYSESRSYAASGSVPRPRRVCSGSLFSHFGSVRRPPLRLWRLRDRTTLFSPPQWGKRKASISIRSRIKAPPGDTSGNARPLFPSAYASYKYTMNVFVFAFCPTIFVSCGTMSPQEIDSYRTSCISAAAYNQLFCLRFFYSLFNGRFWCSTQPTETYIFGV